MSKQHAKMSMSQRAKQFSPFAAVKGLSEEIEKRERLFENRALLSPDRFSELDFTLKGLCPGDKIKITFYSDGLYNEREEIFADADFHSGEGVRSGTVYDAFDTVMPAVAALAPNAKPPGVQ